MFIRSSITAVIAEMIANYDTNHKAILNTRFSGIGPPKGVMGLHRDIEKQKKSRYPKVHQGKQECARRLS